MKVRIVQHSPILGDIEKNLEYHVRRINGAVDDGFDLIIFPELSLSGYHLKDIIFDISRERVDRALVELSKLSSRIDIVAGLPLEEEPGLFYNCVLYFSRGEIVHTHRKVQLPNFGMFEEEMIFRAGDKFESFPAGKMKAGFLVCREILFPVHAYLYYLQNTELIIAVSNSPHRGMGPEGFTSHKLWERLGEVYAINYHQHFIFCNRTGFEDGIGFGGGSFYSAPGKGIEVMGKYYEEQWFDCFPDTGALRRARIGSNYLRDEKPDVILKEMERIIHGSNKP